MGTRKDFIEEVKNAYYSTKAYKEMEYPQEFVLIERFGTFTTKRYLKLVKEYSNYARYVDMRTGCYECFNKIDFKTKEIEVLK